MATRTTHSIEEEIQPDGLCRAEFFSFSTKMWGGASLLFFFHFFLQVPTSFISNNAREVKIVFEDDNATGISDASGLSGTDKFYDLQGRLVYDGQLKKGLYIVNGKKVVIK